MKTEELMRFDWVRLKDDATPRQIDWIRSGEVGLLWNKIVTPPYLEPIPPTPEILEKNGFVANKHVYPYPYYEYINKEDKLKIGFAFPQGNRTSYKEPWVYIDSERVFIEHLPCIFVHQLQHVLRLCRIDKIIEL